MQFNFMFRCYYYCRGIGIGRFRRLSLLVQDEDDDYYFFIHKIWKSTILLSSPLKFINKKYEKRHPIMYDQCKHTSQTAHRTPVTVNK
jgi:hypothetical protein